MANAQLIEMAKASLEHAKAGTIDLADDVFKIPGSNYFDPERFEAEKDAVFKRLPLVWHPRPKCRTMATTRLWRSSIHLSC